MEMSDVTYVGTVSALVEKKSGWHTIEIAVPGKQYPVKADTKLEHLIKQAREIRDQDAVATFTVSETESENINPNNGRPYIERRLQKMELGAGGASAPVANGSPTSASNSGMSKEDWAAKDSAIHRMACIKAAVEALKHTIPADPSTDDLNTFMDRVGHLSRSWHTTVIAVRDHPDDDDIPF